MSKESKPSHLEELHQLTKLARILDKMEADARSRAVAWINRHYAEQKAGKP